MSEKNSWDSFTDDLGSCLGSGCSGILGIIALIAFILFMPWDNPILQVLGNFVLSGGFFILMAGVCVAIWLYFANTGK